MNRLSMYVKQVSNRLETGFRSLKKRFEKSDDTVEAQARTFRIWMWSSAAGLTLILISTVVSMSKEAERAIQKNESGTPSETSLMSSLPEGYVLAPIEPANLESLDSIFEEHGYVDLYRSDDSNSRGAKIARGLPLIRAPKNPRRFAVLVPEEESELLAELNQPVVVVLRKKPKIKVSVRPEKAPRTRQSPLVREPKGHVDVIQEDIPDVAQEVGARS